MERATGILAILAGVLAAALVAAKIKQHRQTLRQLVHIVDDGDREVVAALEAMVRSGELAPSP
jgi:hypothetical protein